MMHTRMRRKLTPRQERLYRKRDETHLRARIITRGLAEELKTVYDFEEFIAIKDVIVNEAFDAWERDQRAAKAFDASRGRKNPHVGKGRTTARTSRKQKVANKKGASKS